MNRDALHTLYIVEHKPMHVIAKELNVAVGTVFNYLKKYNIQSRKISDYPVSQKAIENGRRVGKMHKGKRLSDETKNKIALSHTGKFYNPSKYGGAIKKRSDGYISVYIPSHPLANKDGYVMEHRLVMEEHIGRFLQEDEVVHHKNHNRSDNRLENLQLMTFKEHMSFHMKERYRKGVVIYE